MAKLFIENGSEIDANYADFIYLKTYGFATTPTTPAATIGAGGTLPNATYYYVISTVGENGESVASTEVNAQSSGTDHTATVTWDALDGISKYKVYRGTATGVYDSVTVVFTNTLVDTGSVPFDKTIPILSSATASAGGSLVDDTYYYKITATGINGESLPSIEKSATTSSTNNSVTLVYKTKEPASKITIYKGLASGVYGWKKDVSNTTKFIDDGIREFVQGSITATTTQTSIDYTLLRKSDVTNVSGLYTPAKFINGEDIKAHASVTLYLNEDQEITLDLEEIGNQSAWTVSSAGLKQALDDINAWIA